MPGREDIIEAVRPTVMEVDLAAIRHNVGVLATTAGGARVCAVVKADGYGHGAVPVATAALEAGADWLAVALVEEGEALRAAGIEAPILLLSEPAASADPQRRAAAAARVGAAELTPSVATAGFADDLLAVSEVPVEAHLLIDTGMGRVGMAPADVPGLLDHPGLRVTGVWTHLARADEEVETSHQQLERFAPVVRLVRERRPDAIVHAANTAGDLRVPASHLDLVRVGIGIYGLSPAPDLPATSFGLRQALTLRSAVAFAKHVPAGTPISYGHRWSAPTAGWVATVPIGYADGVPRLLSNRAEVLVRDRRYPIVGSVTMDQLMVFTGDEQPAVGDEVVLLGRQGDAVVSVDEWAAAAETISYEIPCQVTARVPRRHLH